MTGLEPTHAAWVLLVGVAIVSAVLIFFIQIGMQTDSSALPGAYAAMVLVVLGTCVMTPWLLAAPLRTPQTPGRIRR